MLPAVLNKHSEAELEAQIDKYFLARWDKLGMMNDLFFTTPVGYGSGLIAIMYRSISALHAACGDESVCESDCCSLEALK